MLYPSAGPETFSYTLSEAWSAGRPVLVPPIGALPERVASTGAGWILSDAEWRDEAAMLDRILSIVAPAGAEALHAAARAAAARPHASLGAMAASTFAIYARTLAAARVERPRAFAAARLRDALGYRPWSPPVAPVTPAARRSGRAMRRRRTRPSYRSASRASRSACANRPRVPCCAP